MRTARPQTASSGTAAAPAVTAESLGWQLRGVLPPMRLHSVSLYDAAGEVLWLSEGVLGPDEHGAVLEAIATLGADTSTLCHVRELEDGRGALCLAVRAPLGELVGLAMILTDSKTPGTVVSRLATPQVRTVLQRIAVLLRPQAPVRPVPTATAKSAPASAADTCTAEQIDAILELDLVEGGPPAATAPRVPAASSEPAVLVQPLVPLRAGGRTRRYQVMHRSRIEARNAEAAGDRPGQTGPAPDELVTSQLLDWLAAHREAWDSEPASFALSLSAAALESERFPVFFAEAVRRSGVSPGCVGVEIAESACVRLEAQARRLIETCERLGCFVVLDDFALDRAATDFLRSKALRMVKIDPRLTAAAMKDKVSQALVVAIAQVSKVLGVHSVAKNVESQAARQWLAAVGVDFAQGALFGGPRPLRAILE